MVTSMRSVADLLASRSCNEAHWHRPVEGVFPAAASIPHLFCRLMPTFLRRPTLMELAELVAGATIKRRLRSKQLNSETPYRKAAAPSGSLPQQEDSTQKVEAAQGARENPSMS